MIKCTCSLDKNYEYVPISQAQAGHLYIDQDSHIYLMTLDTATCLTNIVHTYYYRAGVNTHLVRRLPTGTKVTIEQE